MRYLFAERSVDMTQSAPKQWMIFNSKFEFGSLRGTRCISSSVPTKLNSWSPSGAIFMTVTHELSCPLLTSAFWVRHDNRATAWARITPKTSAALSCLRERETDRGYSAALWTTSVETFCLDRLTLHATRNRPRSKVLSRQRHLPLIYCQSIDQSMWKGVLTFLSQERKCVNSFDFDCFQSDGMVQRHSNH